MADKPVAHYTINDKGPDDHAKGTLEAPYYTIASGDTLYSIGGRFGVSLGALKKANDLKSDLIHPGDKLVIPGSSGSNDVRDSDDVRDKGRRDHATGAFKAPDYTIASGDTLYSIGTRFGVSVAALKKANGLTSDRIRAGAKLEIPG
jgi:LysM repeat protein